MGFLDALFGRTRTAPSKTKGLFAMSTAYLALEDRHGLRHAGVAGICFRTVASSYFDQMQRELDDLLRISERTTKTTYRLQEDEYGYLWVLLEDPDFEDLVSTLHLVSQTLEEHGFRDRLLAAVFGFRDEDGDQPGGRHVYWVYNYKRGKFYPFVPAGSGQQRDNSREMRLGAVMDRELPVEGDKAQWYALWGIPI